MISTNIYNGVNPLSTYGLTTYPGIEYNPYVRKDDVEEMSDYGNLQNKPQINNTTLEGNQTSTELGLQNTLTFDETPTENSNNPVTSNGVYEAVKGLVYFEEL